MYGPNYDLPGRETRLLVFKKTFSLIKTLPKDLSKRCYQKQPPLFYVDGGQPRFTEARQWKNVKTNIPGELKFNSTLLSILVQIDLMIFFSVIELRWQYDRINRGAHATIRVNNRTAEYMLCVMISNLVRCGEIFV